jgi:HD-GYP domain-containing protein (c-di-GMP phosphodiesterase class II)
MVPLRRLLKQKQLAPLLARAEAMLGPGWRIAITETLDRTDADQPRPYSLPLHVDDVLVGHLSLLAPPGDPPSGNGRPPLAKIGPFLAGCLESLLAGEALRRSLATETLLKYREISLLHRATFGLNGSLRPRDVALSLLTECQRDDQPADVGMVFLRGTEADNYQPVVSFGPAVPCGLADVARSTLFWDIAKTQKGEIINDLGRDQRWRDEASLQSLLLFPLVAAGRCVGMLALACVAPMRFEASHLQYVGTIAAVAGIAMGNALHFEAVQNLINSLMQALATAIDARDPFTAGHSHRVARLGVALARVVHHDRDFFPDTAFSPSDLEELLYAGLLHDVGKIGVREEVLTKSTRLSPAHLDVIGHRLTLRTLMTGETSAEELAALSRINKADAVSREDASVIARLGAQEIRLGDRDIPLLTKEEIACLLIPRGNLTQEERREIERHPAESFRILQHIPFPENMGRLLSIISQHHERLDGSGYPAGLKGADILLQSRIIAIVDIYDAITMARHYKPALPREKALDILWQEAESGRIDGQLVELLGRHIASIETDCESLPDRPDFADYLAASPAAS